MEIERLSALHRITEHKISPFEWISSVRIMPEWTFVCVVFDMMIRLVLILAKTKINISDTKSNQIPNKHTKHTRSHLISINVKNYFKDDNSNCRVNGWAKSERNRHISDLNRLFFYFFFFFLRHRRVVFLAASAAATATACCFSNSQFSQNYRPSSCIYLFTVSIEHSNRAIIRREWRRKGQRATGFCVCVFVIFLLLSKLVPTLCSVASITLSKSCYITIFGWIQSYTYIFIAFC